MREFEFLEPASVQEASALLLEYGDDCRVIAGGTALMLGMRQRMLTPSYLISLGKLRSLRGISYDEQEGLRIGALTLHAEVAQSPIIKEYYPMLAEMASHVANPQVRNQGTIGGNICYADPATDPPTCLMALDARIVINGTHGERVLTIAEFLVDYYVTALKPGEIVTEIRIPAPSFTSGAHVRFLRTAAEHRPLINFAVTAWHQGRHCQKIRVVIGATTAIPTRIERCEAFLQNKEITRAVLAEAAEIIATDIDSISDLRGAEEYRRDMVRVISRRALAKLFDLEKPIENLS
jgi:carbon-monoxide dehydrogenase medium subunit